MLIAFNGCPKRLGMRNCSPLPLNVYHQALLASVRIKTYTVATAAAATLSNGQQD